MNGSSEVRKWALTRASGRELDGSDWRDLLLAVDADSEARHSESLQLLRDHIRDADAYNRRITELETWRLELDTWREDQARTCAARIRELIHQEHLVRHTEYIASLNPDEETQFHERFVWFLTTTAGKVSLVVLGVVLAMVLNLLLYGRP